MVVFGISGCYRAKVVLLEQKLFCSGNVVVFGKVVVNLQSYCIWAKVVVFGEKCFFSDKVVVLGQKWL